MIPITVKRGAELTAISPDSSGAGDGTLESMRWRFEKCDFRLSDRPPVFLVKLMAHDHVAELAEEICGSPAAMGALSLDEISIVETGPYDFDRRHWPMRIRVSFSVECIAWELGRGSVTQERRSFERTLDWQIVRRENDDGAVTWQRR